MKVKLLENNVKVHLSMDETSPSVGMLNSGTVVELGKVATVNNQPWVEIVDGTYVKGYIKGGTKVFGFHKYSLDQEEVVAFDLPATTGLEKARFKRGAILEKIDEIADANKKWYKVRDETGIEGFIDATTVLKDLDGSPTGGPPPLPAAGVPLKPPLSRKEQAKRDMLTGGGLFVVGLVVTIASFSAATSGSGGYYFLCWGPVIFGAIQFFKGLANYAKKD